MRLGSLPTLRVPSCMASWHRSGMPCPLRVLLDGSTARICARFWEVCIDLLTVEPGFGNGAGIELPLFAQIGAFPERQLIMSKRHDSEVGYCHDVHFPPAVRPNQASGESLPSNPYCLWPCLDILKRYANGPISLQILFDVPIFLDYIRPSANVMATRPASLPHWTLIQLLRSRAHTDNPLASR
jgi:hypothetical protein